MSVYRIISPLAVRAVGRLIDLSVGRQSVRLSVCDLSVGLYFDPSVGLSFVRSSVSAAVFICHWCDTGDFVHITQTCLCNMQRFLKVVKITFRLKTFDIFLIFTQNITLEPPR